MAKCTKFEAEKTIIEKVKKSCVDNSIIFHIVFRNIHSHFYGKKVEISSYAQSYPLYPQKKSKMLLGKRFVKSKRLFWYILMKNENWKEMRTKMLDF